MNVDARSHTSRWEIGSFVFGGEGPPNSGVLEMRSQMQIEVIDDSYIDEEGYPITYCIIRHDAIGETHPEIAEVMNTVEGVLYLLEEGGVMGIPSIELCSYVTRDKGPVKEQSILMPPETLFYLWKAYDNYDLKCMANGAHEVIIGSRVAIAPDSLQVGEGSKKNPLDEGVEWHVYTVDRDKEGRVIGGRRVGKCKDKGDAVKLALTMQELLTWED